MIKEVTEKKEGDPSFLFLYLKRISKSMGNSRLSPGMESGRNYMYFTKKAFVVENIIRSRLGFVPERITESYLVWYMENIKKDKKSGPMMIRVKRKKEFKKP